MQYRRLRPDELASLEKEFIRFLAANGLPADEWERIKAQQPERVDELINSFSDEVFEQVLAKVEYLEWRSPRDIKTFHFEAEKIVMNGLLIKGEAQLDFTADISGEDMIKRWQASGGAAGLQLFSAERAYKDSKLKEVFILMEQGALISRDGALFKLLASLKADS